jgi:type I restriction enzyme, S subunit
MIKMSNKIIKNKIGNFFDFISETNLTEKDFYENKGSYPVYSGQTENYGIVANIDTYKQNEPCVTFTTYGLAGKMFYRNGKYTIGRNCMGLLPKEEFKDKINLEWFSYKFQNLFYRLRIGDVDAQRSLNQILLKNIQIKIPDIKTQERQLKLYKNLQFVLNDVENRLNKLNELLSYKIEFESYIYEEKIKKVFKIIGGSGGLTKEFIYNNLPDSIDESIPILSSATIDEKSMGFVSRHSKLEGNNLLIFDAPAILVTRNGHHAGTMKYITNGEFTVNDHAYVLIPKENWIKKINLRWFVNQYQELFYNLVTSKIDNATFNKKYAGKQRIQIPDIKSQNKIAEKLFEIDTNIDKLKKSKEQIEGLIEYEIC